MARNRLAAFSPMNPIKFVRVITPDYASIFPKPDNELVDNESFQGLQKFRFQHNWLTNKQLTFQIHRKGTIAMQVYSCTTGALTTLTGNETNTTPAYWTGGFNVYNYTWTPTSSGTYKILFQVTYSGSTEYYESEYIKVSDSLENCLYLEYSHDNNEYKHVFTQNGSSINFTGEMFLDGTMFESDSSSDSEGYEDDRGDPETLRSTPKVIYDLAFDPLPMYFIQKLLMIFSCRYVEVNNIEVAKIGNLAREKQDQSKAYVITQKVQKQNWDYLEDEIDESFSLIMDDEDDYVSNDSDILISI